MKKGIAIILFALVILTIFLITIEVFPLIKKVIYRNQINDKIAHIFFAGVLTYLANFIFYPKKIRILNKEILLGTVVMFFFYSFDEVSQVFISGRDSDPLDLAAGLVGLFIGDWFVRRWERIHRKGFHMS